MLYQEESVFGKVHIGDFGAERKLIFQAKTL